MWAHVIIIGDIALRETNSKIENIFRLGDDARGSTLIYLRICSVTGGLFHTQDVNSADPNLIPGFWRNNPFDAVWLWRLSLLLRKSPPILQSTTVDEATMDVISDVIERPPVPDKYVTIKNRNYLCFRRVIREKTPSVITRSSDHWG